MRTTCFALFASLALATTLFAGGEKQPDPLPAGAEPPAMMPGEVHAQLAHLAGEFTTVTKFVMSPGTPAEESTGTAKLETVLGSRYLHMKEQGAMMSMPYYAEKLLGYNNGARRYESVWTYTMSTSMLTMTGSSKDGGKTIEFKGSYDEGPAAGGKQDLYVIMKIDSPDSFSIEVRDTPAGQEAQGPVMTTTYTRKK